MMEQREKLIELIKTAFESQENDKCQGCDVYDCAKCVPVYIVDYLLANGVVVPCRCKECVHARKLNANFGVWEYSCMYFNTHATTGNDFCSYAKRKGGDE